MEQTNGKVSFRHPFASEQSATLSVCRKQSHAWREELYSIKWNSIWVNKSISQRRSVVSFHQNQTEEDPGSR